MCRVAFPGCLCTLFSFPMVGVPLMQGGNPAQEQRRFLENMSDSQYVGTTTLRRVLQSSSRGEGAAVSLILPISERLRHLSCQKSRNET